MDQRESYAKCQLLSILCQIWGPDNEPSPVITAGRGHSPKKRQNPLIRPAGHHVALTLSGMATFNRDFSKPRRKYVIYAR